MNALEHVLVKGDVFNIPDFYIFGGVTDQSLVRAMKIFGNLPNLTISAKKRDFSDAIILLIPLLGFVSEIKILKILAIFY